MLNRTTRPRVKKFSWNFVDHTEEGLRKMTLVKTETGNKIPPPEGPFRISFSGNISAPGQDIFTKFGGYIGNELPQGVEWSKHVFFKIQFGRQGRCTLHAIYRRYWSVYLPQVKIFARNLVGM